MSANLTRRHNRKKYRKMRINFERTMRQSNDLFKLETKATAAIRRLTQENEYVTRPPR